MGGHTSEDLADLLKRQQPPELALRVGLRGHAAQPGAQHGREDGALNAA